MPCTIVKTTVAPIQSLISEITKRHKPNSFLLNTPSSSHSAAQKSESFDQEIADLKKEINEYRVNLANASSEERRILLGLIKTSRETLNLLLKSSGKEFF